MSSRMKPSEYGRGMFSKWRKTKFSRCFWWSAGARYFFTHNFLITAAFISETYECSLTRTNTKGFFICNLEIVWAGICRRGRDNCELPRQVSRRKQYSQTPFWAVLTWISAGIKHSCFLWIMLMLTLRPIYTHLSYIISIRKCRRFLFPMIMLVLMLMS